MARNIDIYIDRIVLEGMENLNKSELSLALKEQLTTMISKHGLPTGLLSNSHHERLTGGQLSIQDHPKSKNTGNAIAGSIYHSFNLTE